MGTLKLLHTLTLSNGLSVSIYDRTKLYFGDYFHVRIKIICSLEGATLERELSSPENSSLGTGTYSRSLEKMGVPSEDVERVKKTLLSDFNQTSLPYISSPDFPEKMMSNDFCSKKSSFRKYQGSGL